MSKPVANHYPRETKELQPFTVKLNGVNVTTNVEVSVVKDGLRPTVWTAPVTVGGVLHAWVDGLTFGPYHVWARITDAPEIVVIDCGTFYVD